MTENNTSFNKSKYIMDNFERAMDEGWIEVYYQPIVRTSNGRVCGEEALVRWEDPLLGILNPFDFVPALEASNEVFRLDLYVLEKTLKKMNEQRKRGLYLDPISVNLSQIDFYTCDIIEEVTSRVEKAKISRRMIAISISEGSLAPDNSFLLSQLEQFKELGFQIWMDNYGTGDNAPALLQMIHFDALKINILYVKRVINNEGTRIVMTELIRFAMSLGMETIVEGVESEEQVRFLGEIGCSKLQGFYYCKPVSASTVFARYEDGTAIGFENPEESDYYAAIGKISLYDLSFTRDKGEGLENYFDTLPMAILETDDKMVKVTRSNKSFRKFIISNFGEYILEETFEFDGKSDGAGKYTMTTIRNCIKNGKRQIIDDRLADGRMIQLLIQKIAQNPLSRVAAVAVVILAITDRKKSADDMTYNYIARALSEDYITMYYVNMDTDDYVVYTPDPVNRNVSIENQGTDFFRRCQRDIEKNIYKDDIDVLKKSFTKENVSRVIESEGFYSINYRHVQNGKAYYVSLKAVRVKGMGNYILIGINDVDSQMKQREMMKKIHDEQITYKRIMALSGDYISIYSVDLETDEYVSFIPSDIYEKLDIVTDGTDFYENSRINAKKIAYQDDYKGFEKVFRKEYILKEIEDSGLFVYRYRIIIDGKVIHISVRATLMEEDDVKRMIVGVINVEKEVQREMQYANSLKEAEARATKDTLTGVKNKRAYVDDEDHINIELEAGMELQFAIVVFDLNGLKVVNDTLGHQAGDEYIKEGCKIICDTFARSPVYRIGGDEFVAVVKGKDYDNLQANLEKIQSINIKNKKNGKVTIAVGAAKFESGDKFVSDVFERADSNMYKCKKAMKNNSK